MSMKRVQIFANHISDAILHLDLTDRKMELVKASVKTAMEYAIAKDKEIFGNSENGQ